MPQNSIVTCLDANTDWSNENNTDRITELKRIVDSVHTFIDPEQCIDFLHEMKDEKVFVIVSAPLDQYVVSMSEELPQVDSIYIIDSEKTIDETSVSKLKKVRGIFVLIQDIYELLKGVIQPYDKDSIPISTVSKNDSNDSLTSEHDQSLLLTPLNVPMKYDADNQILRAISSHALSSYPLEDIVVIYLDLNDGAERNWFTEVQRAVNIAKTFIDVDECVDFLTDIENENVLVIVSGDRSLHVVSHLEEFHQVKAIYILSTDKDSNALWMHKCAKVKSVVTEIQPIIASLIRDIQQCERALTPISIIRANNSGTIALDELDQSFMYTQLVKEILLEIKFNDGSRQHFIDFCRHQYSNCDGVLRAVDRFDRDYNTHSPIWWYSKEAFVYSIVNRAFRTQEIDKITMVGFFMQDLHCQIEQLYKNWSDKPSLLVVYRGQGILNNDFERVREGKGGLLSFNNFLSTSTDRDVSLCFADSARADPTLLGVLFQIKINSELSSITFISLDEISHYQEEKEVLFAMHSIFRIDEVHEIDERLWQVDLSSTADDDKNMTELIDFIRENRTGSGRNPWMRLGALLLQMGEFNEAERILNTFIDLHPISAENATGYFNSLFAMGEIKSAQGDFTNALSIFKAGLQLCPPDSNTSALHYGRIARVQTLMGKYADALSNHKKALEILQKTELENDEWLAQSYTHVGHTYLKLGNPSDALSSLNDALKITEKALPSNHPDLGTLYNLTGEAYRMAGDYSRAAFYYEKALRIQEKYLPPNHIELAHTLNDMGLVYDQMGDYSSALSCFQKALQIRQNLGVTDHPEVAKTYHNIGLILNSMMSPLKALSCFQKALDIYEKLSDFEHAELAATYHNIAAVFGQMGNYSTALAFYQKTLNIEQKSLPHDHITLGTTYFNMAATYREMGDYTAAISSLERSREIQEKHLHCNHPELGATYTRLAETYCGMGDHSNALLFLEKSRSIRERCFHPSHPILAETYNSFAVVYQSMGDHSTAISFLHKARIIYEKNFASNDPHFGSVYSNLAAGYHVTGDYSNALLFSERARAVLEKYLPSNHPSLAGFYNNMSAIYEASGDNFTALSFLHKARQIQEKIFPSDHPARVQTCDRIAHMRQKM